MALKTPRIVPSQITPPEVYFKRRAFLAGALAAGVGASIGRQRRPALRAMQETGV